MTTFSSQENTALALEYLSGGGEMGERMRALDWSKTAARSVRRAGRRACAARSACCCRRRRRSSSSGGPSSSSSTTTRTGPCSAPSIRARSACRRARRGARSGTTCCTALLEGVVRTGEAFWAKDRLFLLERHGFPEETFFDVSYDPVRDESGARRRRVLHRDRDHRARGRRAPPRAAARPGGAQRGRAHRARRVRASPWRRWRRKPQDVPFALVYLDDDAAQACARPARRRQLLASPARAHAGTRSGSPRRRTARESCVVGLNPRRPFDEQYRRFLDLVAGQIATAIANAQAYEEERQRARGAGRARPREDRVLQQREPRVPHAAHADARPARGAARPRRCRRSAASCVERGAAQRPAPAQAREHAARFLAHRGRARSGVAIEPTDLAALTADLASIFRSACERAGLRLVVDCPPLGRGARTSTARCGRRSSSTCSRTRSSSRSRARSRCSCVEDRRTLSPDRCATPASASPQESLAARVRALPPRRRRARPQPRRQRHRPGAGAGAGEAARRFDQRRRASSGGAPCSPSRCRSATRTCRANG